mmetsp:Transcript_25790/g.66497  ORF Transcript_25790/g.66497 Transcript_25790/m.66497 type:complete len:704 (+) Transcript_25790:3-2114(+)
MTSWSAAALLQKVRTRNLYEVDRLREVVESVVAPSSGVAASDEAPDPALVSEVQALEAQVQEQLRDRQRTAEEWSSSRQRRQELLETLRVRREALAAAKQEHQAVVAEGAEVLRQHTEAKHQLDDTRAALAGYHQTNEKLREKLEREHSQLATIMAQLDRFRSGEAQSQPSASAFKPKPRPPGSAERPRAATEPATPVSQGGRLSVLPVQVGKVYRRMVYNAAMEAAYNQRGYAQEAQRAQADREKQLAALKKDSEIPADVCDLLNAMAMQAANHRANSKSAGGFGAFLGMVTGSSSDAKEQFNRLADRLMGVDSVDPVLSRHLKEVAAYSARFVCNSMGGANALDDLCRVYRHMLGVIWTRPKWRGVKLRGWLALDRTVCHVLWGIHGAGSRCEYSLCEGMGAAAKEHLAWHRETFVSQADFMAMSTAGLNAVRIPFGYWAVTGPTKGEPFVGPCLLVLDQAISWARQSGLQVILDLQAAPGGQSGSAASGREDRTWNYKHWAVQETYEVIDLVARRYAQEPCVSGFAVLSDPCDTIPVDVLIDFCTKATQVVRTAGMTEDRVAVLLPGNEAHLPGLTDHWYKNHGRYDINFAFDVQCYQAPGWRPQWAQLRVPAGKAREMERLPSACVSGWSLALSGDPQAVDAETTRDYASKQVEAYDSAPLGWFFHAWTDGPGRGLWDFRECSKQGLFPALKNRAPAGI